MGLEVIYNGMIVLNPYVRENLIKLDNALPGDVVVTGGDRYRDADRNIRSASNGRIVPNASQTSPHLYRRGARAVDIAVPDATDRQIRAAAKDKTSFSDPNTKKYPDGHTHVSLPPYTQYKIPKKIRDEFCKQNPGSPGCSSPTNNCH